MSFINLDKTMISRKIPFSIALVFSFALIASHGVNAQDKNQVRTLTECQQAWVEINEKFDSLEKQIAGGEGVEEAKREFEKTSQEAERLIVEMETAAKTELEKDRTSGAALRALMGMAVDAAADGDDPKVLELGHFLIGKGINPKYFEVAAKTEKLTILQKQIFDELLIRQAEALKNDLPRVEFETTKGKVVLELFENEAPGTVGNFVNLVERKYFDGMLFHRVLEGFMAQSGGYKLDDDKKEQGGEGPGYEIRCECYEPGFRKHFTGSLSMAKKPGLKDSGGSEFFITLDRTDFLDGEHTVFGRVLSGFDVIESLERTHVSNRFGQEKPIEGVLKDKIVAAKVLRKRAREYVPVKFDRKKEAAQAATESDTPNLTTETKDDATDGLNLDPPK
jgi:cyclophilin family peptidyl-prolyl cis-trans isomerase